MDMYGGGYAPAYYGGYSGYYGGGYAPAYYGGYYGNSYPVVRYRRVVRPAYAYYGGPRYYGGARYYGAALLPRPLSSLVIAEDCRVGEA